MENFNLCIIIVLSFILIDTILTLKKVERDRLQVFRAIYMVIITPFLSYIAIELDGGVSDKTDWWIILAFTLISLLGAMSFFRNNKDK